jgi:hypothetical protein
VRNAVETEWYVWRKQNPDWVRDKEAKDPILGPRDFINKELYYIGCDAAPTLSRKVVSSCKEEVINGLKANMPYNHEGKAKYRWQAVLWHEVALSTHTRGIIPVPNQDAVLGYDGLVLPGDEKPNREMVERACKSGCVLRYILLSRKSGYEIKAPIVRLEVGTFKKGQKALLRKIVSGEIKFADSKFVERDGKWYFQLCYDVPHDSSDFPVDNVLTIMPNAADQKSPFVALFNGTGKRYMGYANGYVADYRRIQARRRAIRHRYKSDAGKGHGKQRAYKSLQPMSRAVKDMQGRYQKLLVSDLEKLLLREKCGKVVYHEPSLPVRTVDWYSKHDVPFDWTKFGQLLAFKFRKVQYVVERLCMKEYKE